MPWVRLDDAFYDNAKFSDLSNAGVGAWVKLLAFSGRNLTDGAITKVFALRLASRREIGELVAVGLLDPTDAGWRLHDYLDYQVPADSVREQRAELSARRAAAGKRGGDATATRKQTSSNPPANDAANGEQTPSPIPIPIPIPTETNDHFDEFWTAYPRKLGKPEARKAWTRALRKAPADTIIGSLPAWCRSWTDPRFIPHPSTWLNREQWDDAPVTPASSNGHGPDLEVAAALAKFAGNP